MYYKNCTSTVKTFYGVTFKPGEIKDVIGYINSPGFVRTSKPKEPPTEKVEKRKYTKRAKSIVPVDDCIDSVDNQSLEADVIIDSSSIDAELTVHDDKQENT